jgi:hypothetical protein
MESSELPVADRFLEWEASYADRAGVLGKSSLVELFATAAIAHVIFQSPSG